MIRYLLYLAIAVIEVHWNNHCSGERLRKRTERRIISMVRKAYKNVPYYKQLYDQCGVDINDIKTLDDLPRLPFITKDEIREQFPRGIVSKKFDIEDCHYSATTGSTGRSLPFVFDLRAYAFYIATGLRMYTMIGYRPWHRMTYIKYTAIKYPRFGPFFRTNHIPSTIPADEQIAMLRKTKPDLLLGYASLVFEIAQKVTPDDLKHIRPKFIGINSELSTKDQRDFISTVFGCPVYDEYSTEETWMISSQCRHGNYHLFIDNVWVEFLDKNGNAVKPGEEGEIVLTTSRCDAMPFIRYRIGDIGRYAANSCSCGLGYPLLESFDGRADDSFVLPSGRYVSSLKILNTFTKYIKKYLHLMEEFKIIQKDRGYIVIELVRGREYNERRFQELIDSLNEIFVEPVTINVEYVEKISMSNGIKRKAIESWVTGKDRQRVLTSAV
ncbi:MAG: phenylacetate--CoA ligase family protein [Spirochaetes bacterium]|nr:phenylacetate--CoA ligase family protein [Spirochaetota bacterium]